MSELEARTEKELVHLDPDCTGEWHIVSARNTRAIKGRTGRFYFCERCKAHFPADETGYTLAYWREVRMQEQLRTATRERRAVKAMAVAIRDDDVTLTWDRAEAIAEAAMRGLRARFLQVAENNQARSEWEQRTNEQIRPLVNDIKQILAVAEGAKIARAIIDDRGSRIEVHVMLPERHADQEAVIESQLQALSVPDGYEGLSFMFHFSGDQAA